MLKLGRYVTAAAVTMLASCIRGDPTSSGQYYHLKYRGDVQGFPSAEVRPPTLFVVSFAVLRDGIFQASLLICVWTTHQLACSQCLSSVFATSF
jgi:hypothetical protein